MQTFSSVVCSKCVCLQKNKQQTQTKKEIKSNTSTKQSHNAASSLDLSSYTKLILFHLFIHNMLSKYTQQTIYINGLRIHTTLLLLLLFNGCCRSQQQMIACNMQIRRYTVMLKEEKKEMQTIRWKPLQEKKQKEQTEEKDLHKIKMSTP